MIVLYSFGPAFGLPDLSPFVTKVEVLLKMSGLPYRTDTTGFGRAPKGKLPYIEDVDGTVVADSTFIRWHLERKYGIDFDKGLSVQEKATAWALERMCEDHLYWVGMYVRFMDDRNFDAGPRDFFKRAPLLIRPFVIAYVRRQVKRNLWGHGLGRHSRSEIETLAMRDIDVLADALGDRRWLMGDEPCGADAALWSFIMAMYCPLFESPVRTAAERHTNLIAYRDRGLQRWFPSTSLPSGERAALGPSGAA